MPHPCFLGCPSDPVVHTNGFPDPKRFPDRFKKWVDLVGGQLKTPKDYAFYRKKRLCARHFTEADRNRNNRLNVLAVPSLFLRGVNENNCVPTTSEVQNNTSIEIPLLQKTCMIDSTRGFNENNCVPTTSVVQNNASIDVPLLQKTCIIDSVTGELVDHSTTTQVPKTKTATDVIMPSVQTSSNVSNTHVFLEHSYSEVLHSNNEIKVSPAEGSSIGTSGALGIVSQAHSYNEGDGEGRTDPDGPTLPSLSRPSFPFGAALKRYYWWRAQGKEDEVLVLCKRPFTELRDQREVQARRKRESQRARERENSVRVGIIDVNKLATEDELLQLQEALLEKIDTSVGYAPKFFGCSMTAGRLLLTCADDATREWLTIVVPELRPWEGASLKLVNAKDLPKPMTGVAWVPNADLDPKKLVHRLELQNPQVGCGHWRVLNRKFEEKGQTVTFSFDRSSYEALKDSKCKLFFDLGIIQLRVKDVKYRNKAWSDRK